MKRRWKRLGMGVHRPRLTFAPLAWLKLQYFCHAGDTEIGGFGISAQNNLLHVEDFVTVRQKVTAVSVAFDDDAVADFYDRMVDAGIPLGRCSRIWCHTHPGASVTPSFIDEETFTRCFGTCDWSLMFIAGRTGKTYARLAFSAGPAAQLLLPTSVQWSAWPATLTSKEGMLKAAVEEWQAEFAANIHVQLPSPIVPGNQAVPDWEGEARGLADPFGFDHEYLFHSFLQGEQ